MKLKQNLRECAGLSALLMLALSGCAGWAPDFIDRGLMPVAEQVGADGPGLLFEFEPGDGAGSNDQVFGAGYIVISEAGQEIQALPHSFEMPKQQIDREHWLSFKDFNGDGWQDFVVSRMQVGPGQLPINSLYQFDPKIRKFFQVNLLSNVGHVSALVPGCAEIKSRDDPGVVKQNAYCFVASTGRWTLQPGLNNSVVSDLAQAACLSVETGLTRCRKARMELDRQLLVLVRAFRNDRRESLEREVGKHYASTYVRQMNRNHVTWLRYRDARCMAQVREQAIPVNKLGAAVESCRFERAREQYAGYKNRLLTLAVEKGS